jgi:tetrahydromethanopterin S-methyltransferase subunit G
MPLREGGVHGAPGTDLRVLAEVVDLVRSIHERLDGIDRKLDFLESQTVNS